MESSRAIICVICLWNRRFEVHFCHHDHHHHHHHIWWWSSKRRFHADTRRSW